MDAEGPKVVRHNSIGDVLLESPFTLAALSGYSDMGMRVTCRSLGASLTRHEVVLDRFVLDGGKGARSGRHMDPSDRPIAAQLMGSAPAELAGAARKMESLGYDLIDVNFGCPVRKVLGRCRGGYLLGDPATAIAILSAVRDAVSRPVSLKMRRGRDDTAESADRFWAILEAAVTLGIDAVAIHGRTVAQKYDGRASWDVIAQVKQRFPELVVFGSGDLFTAEDCMAMLRRTGCDGVTIARGAIGNPWIFRECLALWHGKAKPAPPTVLEQGELFHRQYQLALQQYGPRRAGKQMRKFGIRRAHLHPRADELRRAFISLTTPGQWQELLQRFFGAAEAESDTEETPGRLANSMLAQRNDS